MEILIMKYGSLNRYWEVFSDNFKMEALGEFLNGIGVNFIENWFENPTEWCNEEVALDVEGNSVKIYIDRGYGSLEDNMRYYSHALIMSRKKFIKMLRKWYVISVINPTFVIVKKVGDKITFREDYRKNIELDLAKSQLPEITYNHLIKPNIKNDLFYGGYHLRNSSQKLEMSNQLVGDAGVMSFDIRFAKDFTFNHAFFPSSWDKKRLKKEIIQSLKRGKIKELPFFEKFSNENGTFFILDRPSEEYVWMRLICNEKLEVVTCYPIFRK